MQKDGAIHHEVIKGFKEVLHSEKGEVKGNFKNLI
jgi:hypothetical protein